MTYLLLVFIAIFLCFINTAITMRVADNVCVSYEINDDIKVLTDSFVGAIAFIACLVSVHLGWVFDNLSLIIAISMGIFIVHSAVSWFAVTPDYKTNIKPTLHKIKL